MSDTTATPSAGAEGSAPDPAAAAASAAPATPDTTATTDAAESQTAKALKGTEVTIRSLLEAGVHFGHQTGRWNPKMKPYIFGERAGTHILDLDQTLPLFKEAIEFIREVTAHGGKVLFVGTKRQAAGSIMTEARRAGQYYVNNRWLGGMLTNWKTVKKSIDRYKQLIEIQEDEDKREALSKKELANVNRQREKYEKSLEGIREMERLPNAIFVIDVGREAIAISEAARLGIPVIAVVDSNCSPRDVDFVVPGNDDAVRAIELYCSAIADACLEGGELYQAELIAQRRDQPQEAKGGPGGSKTGRRVVEIKQQPRRGRGGSGSGGGRPHTAGGWGEKSEGKGGDRSGEKAGEKAAEKASAEAPAAAETPKTEG